MGFARNHITESGVVTVQTHVDNLKIYPQQNRVTDDLRKIYQEMMVHDGESHDYLGMVMTHDKERQQVKTDMGRYIENCIMKKK
jgi:hypothetical protein